MKEMRYTILRLIAAALSFLKPTARPTNLQTKERPRDCCETPVVNLGEAPDAPASCVEVRLGGLPSFNMFLHRGIDIYISSEIKHNGVWEALETEVVRASLPDRGIFIDVGANIGWYTVVASLSLGVGGRVLAFEPDPSNFNLLKANISVNHLNNVTAINAAVGKSVGRTYLYKSPDNMGDHRIYAPRDEDPRETVKVPIITLDDFLINRSRLDAVDVVKLDTQGAEFAILSGFSEGIQRWGPSIKLITEFWPYGLWGSGASADALLDVFVDWGSLMFIIDEWKRCLTPITAENLRQMVQSSLNLETKAFVNLLVWPAGIDLPPSLRGLISEPFAS